jgi:EAL domain-containing protein (putative c-di-GMP-specific phosphodiesterase class I)
MSKQNNIIAFPTAAQRPRWQAPAGHRSGVCNLTAHRAQQAKSLAQDKAPAKGTTKADTKADTEDKANRPLPLGEVWDALNAGRIQMHYQPQYDLTTGEIMAAEALLRLVDTDGELVYPDRFIELVEHSDMIVPLGRAVIEQVCTDLVATRAAGRVLPRVAINLSAHQLNCDTELLGFLDQTLVAHGLNYSDLEFELTERQRLDSASDGVAVLNVLAARGSRIVIDDFGIGYSSVVCLTELPISAFKLDRALIGRLPEDAAIQSVVQCLLKLADHLELDVVAEGVETPAQHAWLVEAGCLSGQGFGYARPMAFDALQDLLREHQTDTVQGLMQH